MKVHSNKNFKSTLPLSNFVPEPHPTALQYNSEAFLYITTSKQAQRKEATKVLVQVRKIFTGFKFSRFELLIAYYGDCKDKQLFLKNTFPKFH